jgi:hypothetical protein
VTLIPPLDAGEMLTMPSSYIAQAKSPLCMAKENSGLSIAVYILEELIYLGLNLDA